MDMKTYIHKTKGHIAYKTYMGYIMIVYDDYSISTTEVCTSLIEGSKDWKRLDNRSTRQKIKQFFNF